MKRILQIPARPGARLVAEFAQTSTAHLSDSMERLYAATGLRPMHRDGTLAGPAFTVKTAPGDNLLVHKALDMAQAGDVVVVDAGGFCEQAVIGEIMAGWAARRGIAGLVIWGAIRDSAEIRAGSFPVFACGVTHRGPYKDGPGEINVPIALAGMPVHPGDIVVGDADGVVVVPREEADEVLRLVTALVARERARIAEIDSGVLFKEEINETLKKRGVLSR